MPEIYAYKCSKCGETLRLDPEVGCQCGGAFERTLLFVDHPVHPRFTPEGQRLLRKIDEDYMRRFMAVAGNDVAPFVRVVLETDAIAVAGNDLNVLPPAVVVLDTGTVATDWPAPGAEKPPTPVSHLERAMAECDRLKALNADLLAALDAIAKARSDGEP